MYDNPFLMQSRYILIPMKSYGFIALNMSPVFSDHPSFYPLSIFKCKCYLKLISFAHVSGFLFMIYYLLICLDLILNTSSALTSPGPGVSAVEEA